MPWFSKPFLIPEFYFRVDLVDAVGLGMIHIHRVLLVNPHEDDETGGESEPKPGYIDKAAGPVVQQVPPGGTQIILIIQLVYSVRNDFTGSDIGPGWYEC